MAGGPSAYQSNTPIDRQLPDAREDILGIKDQLESLTKQVAKLEANLAALRETVTQLDQREL